jgi:hypothetical protein
MLSPMVGRRKIHLVDKIKIWELKKMFLALELPWSFYFKFCKNHISNFQTIMKRNLDIVNDVTYNHEKIYYEILLLRITQK